MMRVSSIYSYLKVLNFLEYVDSFAHIWTLAPSIVDQLFSSALFLLLALLFIWKLSVMRSGRVVL